MKDHLKNHHLRDEEANRELLENVHPLSWKNPEAKGRYNLVVVGAGTAGLVTAAGAAALGARVALIEKGLMGGDCLNVGCVPSKGIIRGGRAIFDAKNAGEFGVSGTDSAEIDFQKIMRRMRSLRAKISPHDSAKRFSEQGVDVYFGEARFTSPETVEVGEQKLHFSKAVIATGGRARLPEIEGLEKTGFHTNESIFELDGRPRRLLVLGAGPIGTELAQAFHRLGSKVTLVTHGPQIMSKEDPDVAEIVAQSLRKEGLEIVTNAQALRFEEKEGSKVFLYKGENSEERSIEVDEILVSVGRVPNVETLDLEKAGVEKGREGVAVNDRLQTSNSKIYAAGDVASRFKFTHAAEALARIAIQNALFFGRKKASDLNIPWTTYTDPEAAHVGIHSKEANARSDVKTITLPFEKNDRAILDGETEGLVRAHYETKGGKLLGATIVARHAGEMIGEVVMAMNQGLSVGALASTIHPYPSQADMIRQLGNEYQRGRLSPKLKTFLEKFFAWRR